MAKWHIGCSGFHYRHWRGGFYPEKLAQKDWFNFYNQQLKTVELNVTFYRFPVASTLQTWYENSSADFRFSVKMFKGITHYKQFRNCEKMIADFYRLVQEGLKEKVGCILFQLPPRTKYKEEKLQLIIDNVNPAFNNVIEFRHESWWNPEVYAKLGASNITFCGQSHPDLPQDVIQNSKVLYYRFHGIPDLYRSPYSNEKLDAVASEIQKNKKVKQAYIYFNNDIDVSAIHNALHMKAFVEGLTK